MVVIFSYLVQMNTSYFCKLPGYMDASLILAITHISGIMVVMEVMGVIRGEHVSARRDFKCLRHIYSQRDSLIGLLLKSLCGHSSCPLAVIISWLCVTSRSEIWYHLIESSNQSCKKMFFSRVRLLLARSGIRLENLRRHRHYNNIIFRLNNKLNPLNFVRIDIVL